MTDVMTAVFTAAMEGRRIPVGFHHPEVVSRIALGLSVARFLVNVPLESGTVETLIPFLVVLAGGVFIVLMMITTAYLLANDKDKEE